MITSLELKNFKIFENQSFEFRNLNLLTGLNSAGKSTVIQSLLLLREAYMDKELLTKGMQLSPDNKLCNLGTVKDVLYYKTIKPLIEINIGMEDTIQYFSFDAATKLSLKPFLPLQQSKHDEDIIERTNLFSENNFIYLSANRILPKDRYERSQEAKNKFKNDGENAIAFLHDNKERLKVAKELCKPNISDLLGEQVNAWLQEISPEIKFRTTDTNGKAVHLDYAYGNSPTHFEPKNVGFGITYNLPIIIALLSAQAGDLIIIENPEAHLHPKGQSKLAELMCLAAQAGVQIFCETHSDHIINGVRVGIVNKYQPIDLDKVNILYFYRNENQSNSQIEVIKIDEYAKIEYNERTKGFFDQIQNDLKKIRTS